MSTRREFLLTSASLMAAYVAVPGTTTIAFAQKYKTDIPPAITAPDSMETRLGTLRFKNGWDLSAQGGSVDQSMAGQSQTVASSES